MTSTSILSTIASTTTIASLVAEAVATAIPVPPAVAIPDAVLTILGGLCDPRRRRPRGWSRQRENREGQAFSRRALRIDALLQGHDLGGEGRPVARSQDIILALDVVQRALEVTDLEERLQLLSLEADLQGELEAVDPMTFGDARAPAALSRHFAGMNSDPGALASGQVEEHRLADLAREWEALGEEEEPTASTDASLGVWGEDATGVLAGSDAMGSLAASEWDGEYQASLEAVDAGLVRVAPLSGPDAEAEIAERIRDLFDPQAEVEQAELLRLARTERPADVETLVTRMGFEASPEDISVLRGLIFQGRISFAPDWEARDLRGDATERLSTILGDLISQAPTAKELKRLQGRIGRLMAISKAREAGSLRFPDGKPLPTVSEKAVERAISKALRGWTSRLVWRETLEAIDGLGDLPLSPERVRQLRELALERSVPAAYRTAAAVAAARGEVAQLESAGMPFSHSAPLANRCALKALQLVVPGIARDWAIEGLTYALDSTRKPIDAQAKADADLLAEELEHTLQLRTRQAFRVYAIGVYPERVSPPAPLPEVDGEGNYIGDLSRPGEDMLDGHAAQQGSFLAEEAPVAPEAEERLSQLSIRELLEEPLKGSWVEEQPWGCFRLSPSVLVGNRSDEGAEPICHRAVEEVAPGVVKTLWAPCPWEVEDVEVPAIEGWPSLHSLVRHISRCLPA